MFALEIRFTDGVSEPETILVRRPQALIGASEYAHVAIEDLGSLDYQIRIVRDLGRKFRCKPVGASEQGKMSDLLGGVYDGETSLDTGPVQLHITSLDFDLMLRDGEPPDRAGVRVLRQVCAAPSPEFPGIVVMGSEPMIVSFVPDQPVYLGRSNICAVRLDASDVSAKHARMGYESGEFWIEDLGSTNGTFVNKQQISGRVSLAPATPVVLGREVTVFGVSSAEQIGQVRQMAEKSGAIPKPQLSTYPILISASEVARPSRLMISAGSEIRIGRDPSSEVWLGAPHVSRKHCVVTSTKTGDVLIRDFSTNGTAYETGILHRGDTLELAGSPRVLNFGGGITVAICFDLEQEQQFMAEQGSPHAFLSPEEVARLDQNFSPDINVGTQVRSGGERRSTGGFEGTIDKDIRKVFSRLSFSKKLMLVLTGVLLALVVAVVVNLLAPVIGGF